MVLGVLVVRIWGGAGVSVQVCMLGAAFEVIWWWFGLFQMDTVHSNTYISLPVCTTDMVDSMELERGVTTTGMMRKLLRVNILRSLLQTCST